MYSFKSFARNIVHFCLAVVARLRFLVIRKPTLIILTYHRILPEESLLRHQEQPGMVASPETLACHLRLFRSMGAEFVDLESWVNRRNGPDKNLPRLAVAVTFDDGWRDNFLYGYPILKQFQAPATIFLVSQYLNTTRLFWPEQVIRLLVSPPAERPEGISEWLSGYSGALPLAHRALTIEEADGVINQLKQLDDQSIIDHLEQLAPTGQGQDDERQILDSRELREMYDSGLVRFGAHTRQHFRLNRLGDTKLISDEITLCKHDLEAQDIGQISLFCYPNGDITADGEQIVATSYLGACTTRTGLNGQNTPSLRLRRFNFHDGNGKNQRLCLSTIGRSLVSI